ncbi:transcription elongation factor Elf1 like-domain-containing protein, partial [Tuber indicum]
HRINTTPPDNPPPTTAHHQLHRDGHFSYAEDLSDNHRHQEQQPYYNPKPQFTKVIEMGKRKRSTRKPTVFKKKDPLATTFMCLFCNNQDTVACMLNKKAGIGSLSCSSCGQRFKMSINYLSAPIDVYSEWVDACDEIENPKVKAPRRVSGNSRDVGSGDREGGGGGARNKNQRNHDDRDNHADDDSDANDDGYVGKV